MVTTTEMFTDATGVLGRVTPGLGPCEAFPLPEEE